MSEVHAERRSGLLPQLSAATRNGIFSDAVEARGFDVRQPSGDLNHIESEELSHRIAQISDDDIESYVHHLIVERVEPLNLTGRGLLKLQATLLLAAHPAEVYEFEPRRAAVTRTYLRQPKGDGQPWPDGERYRDSGKAERLSRDERYDLLNRIALALEGLQPEEDPDPYSTVLYEGRHIEPGSSSEPVIEFFRRRIRANRDGVAEFRQIFTYAVYGSAAPTATNLGPGHLTFEHVRELQTSHITGTRYECVVRFPPLNRNETIELVWFTVSTVDESYFDPHSRLRAFGVAPRGDVPSASVFIKFADNRLPVQAWKLSGTPADGIDFVDDSDPRADVTQEFYEEWNGLKAGRAYVFRWRWNPRDEAVE
jgi:hypothetical protein